MLKLITPFILVLNVNFLYSQFCTGKINCFDKLGNKYGYWKEKRVFPYDSLNKMYIRSNAGIIIDGKYQVYTTAEGNYINNIKLPGWIYYSHHEFPCEGYMFDITEVYPDGSFNVKKYDSEILYDKDSNIIFGEIYNLLDTIDIYCYKNNCDFCYKNETIKEVYSDNYNRIFFEILMFANGHRKYKRTNPSKKNWQ
ncbi:MAG TPA: hypothetical protein PKG56_04680 [Chitinophagaceae bacterium]|nr:hypothetical protein [Chitinophagales bacterium]HNL82666.1 hypothetical protein [Chitinophagaceae bacterium]